MTQIKKLNNEQKKIVEDNLALAAYVAKKYLNKNDYIKNQDIIQEAIYAMIKAIPNYDPDKAKLSTYLYPTIDGHLKRFVCYRDRIIPIPHQKHLKKETQDKAQNAKSVFSLEREIRNGNGNAKSSEEVTLIDILPGEFNIENKIIDRLIIIDAIKSLAWKEKLIIIYRYYFDLNQTYIGKLMGLSQVHVHRIERKALKTMKQYLIK